MVQHKGMIGWVGSKKARNDNLLWSFALDSEDKKYYGCLQDEPTRPDGSALEPGDLVIFEYEDGKYGPAVDMKTFRSKVGKGAPPKKAKSGGGKGGSRDDYWAQKEAFDKTVTAPIIHFQSATNSAVQIACAALEKNMLALGTGKAKQLEAFMTVVKTIRKDIYLGYEAAFAKLQAGESLFATEAVKEPDGFDDLEEMQTANPDEPVDEFNFDDDIPF